MSMTKEQTKILYLKRRIAKLNKQIQQLRKGTYRSTKQPAPKFTPSSPGPGINNYTYNPDTTPRWPWDAPAGVDIAARAEAEAVLRNEALIFAIDNQYIANSRFAYRHSNGQTIIWRLVNSLSGSTVVRA